VTSRPDLITYSESESRRFALKLGRAGAAAVAEPTRLRDEIIDGAWDALILRIPCGGERIAAQLRELGLEPSQADTLVTWQADLQSIPMPAPEAPAGCSLRPARAADTDAITALVHSVFARYPNHYAANPLLDPALALEGYVEWALSHVDHPDRLCWLAMVGNEVAALACSSHAPAAGEAVGVLHGVDPRFGGRGIYRWLIETSLQHYRKIGYRVFSIATQVGNQSVQRVWGRLGLELAKAEATFHLMPLLGRASAAAELGAVPGESFDEALQSFWRRHHEWLGKPAGRSSLSVAADAHPEGPLRMHGLRLDRGGRVVSVLVGAVGRPVAWIHTDLNSD
jgi:GNAT superfamily N-acetyltransferase